MLINHATGLDGRARCGARSRPSTSSATPLSAGRARRSSEGGSSAARFCAFALVALTLARAAAPILAALLLAAGGVLIQIAHVNPYGPLGFACVLAGGVLLIGWRARLPAVSSAP